MKHSSKADSLTRQRLYLYQGLELMVEIQARGRSNEPGCDIRVIYNNDVDLVSARKAIMSFADVLQHTVNYEDMGLTSVDQDYPNEGDDDMDIPF